MRNQRPKLLCMRRGGFSVVEVLMGFLVLSIAMGSAVQLSFALAKVTQRNHYLNGAVTLAEAKLEELRNAAFDEVVSDADAGQLGEDGLPGEVYTRSWVVTDNTPVAGLKYVEIAVQWQQGGITESYDLCGVVEP